MADYASSREGVTAHVDDERTVFLRVGYQVEGTLVRAVEEGCDGGPDVIEIDGDSIPFRAQVFCTSAFSGR
jgi:predicted metal-dependent RNase